MDAGKSMSAKTISVMTPTDANNPKYRTGSTWLVMSAMKPIAVVIAAMDTGRIMAVRTSLTNSCFDMPGFVWTLWWMLLCICMPYATPIAMSMTGIMVSTAYMGT